MTDKQTDGGKDPCSGVVVRYKVFVFGRLSEEDLPLVLEEPSVEGGRASFHAVSRQEVRQSGTRTVKLLPNTQRARRRTTTNRLPV